MPVPQILNNSKVIMKCRSDTLVCAALILKARKTIRNSNVLAEIITRNYLLDFLKHAGDVNKIIKFEKAR